MNLPKSLSRNLILALLLSIGLTSQLTSPSNAQTVNSKMGIKMNSQSIATSKEAVKTLEAHRLELKNNIRLWNRNRISSYTYTLTRSCFCTPEATQPVIVKVRNGQFNSLVAASNGSSVNPESFQSYTTVPKLFAVIEDAIKQKAASISVKYHPRFGYPTEINIDYNLQLADEELFLRVDNLKPVKNGFIHLPR
jgi:Family of unknown function (DUF6174)